MAFAIWQATIVDDAGNVLPAAQIEVRSETSGSPLATIYQDRDGDTPLGNPFNANAAPFASDGFVYFYAANGAYKITATSGSFSRTLRYVAIGAFCPTTEGITFDPGSDIDTNLLTVNVTGTPVISWDESSDGFRSNKPWVISTDDYGDLIHTLSGVPVTSDLEIHSQGSADLGGIAIHRHVDLAGFGGHLIFLRSRGSHDTTIDVVQDGDVIGHMYFCGYDGTDYEFTSSIRSVVDGTPGNNDMPGALEFYTNAGSQTLVKRMGLPSAGGVDIPEISEPASPAANVARLFARDVSSQTQLAFKNSSGQVIDLLGIGKKTIWIPASAMVPATTNGPASAQVETGSNAVNLSVLDFDGATAEYAHFQIAMPKGWNEGTITYQVFWETTATDTDTARWAADAQSMADGETIDGAFGTAQTVNDAGSGTAGDLLVTAESSAVTIGGSPAEGDLCLFRLWRDATNGADTMAEDARLIGIKLFYTTNANTDD